MARKKDPPQKAALREMMGNYLKENNKSILTVRKLLTDDFKTYDATATEANIGELLADCFIEIIRSSAGLVQQSVLENRCSRKLY